MFSRWYSALQKLRDLVPQQQFLQWISPLQARENEKELVIYAPNQYVLDGVMSDYFQVIEQTLFDVDPANSLKIRYVVGVKDFVDNENKKDKLTSTENDSGFSDGKNFLNEPRDLLEEKNISFESKLASQYTFDSFVIGKSNQLAMAAAKQISKNPGKAYNPLFIYGGVGLGKTHLMQAVGNAILSQNKHAKVLYLHSERFVANMVRALQENKIDDFKKFYRGLDVLLIDDIQFFAGKDRSQEEFFHTFNSLLEGQQQIILTSDKYPKEIKGIEERLKSRFGSGLTVSIEPPDLETRVAILMNKAFQNKISMSNEIAFFIAKRVCGNIRELEGVLKRIIATSHFSKSEITLDFVKEALKDLLAIQEKLISVDNIIKAVSEYYKLSISDLLSKKRSRNISRPRQIAMYLCKQLTERSFPEIGNAFGGKDHTTVLHACKKVSQMKDFVPEVNQDLENIIKNLST